MQSVLFFTCRLVAALSREPRSGHLPFAPALGFAPLLGIDPLRSNLVVNAMDLGGEVLVSELRSVTDDDIAFGSVADRCLLRGVEQTSHF
jgi:hypothetical protein